MARTTAQLEGRIVRGTTAGVQHSSSEAIANARHAQKRNASTSHPTRIQA